MERLLENGFVALLSKMERKNGSEFEMLQPLSWKSFEWYY